ncbi:MAG: hypothetical protein IKI97_10690 [Clostridia bacterium]|nr:hypothetical protein [Clostridia bacterium]
MFNNIGSKIKNLANIITVIGIAISMIIGLILMIIALIEESFSGILVALIWASIGSLFLWISSFILYGLGELIDSNMNCNTLLNQQNTILIQIRDSLEVSSGQKNCPKQQPLNDNKNIATGITADMIQDWLDGKEPLK